MHEGRTPRSKGGARMPNPVAHFEIYGDDPGKLAGFYRTSR